MNKIFFNSLNKKILILGVLLLLFGYLTQAFFQIPQKTIQGKNSVEIYRNPRKILDNKRLTQEQSDIKMRFLPIHEVEQILKNYRYEELYVKTDPNFDQKTNYLKIYLQRRNSPLAEKRHYLVLMSNKFELDYRLLAAISIIESSGGLKLYRRYNAWGWGGAKGFHFENWEHSIYVVSRGLARYRAAGAITPEQIAPTYNPHTPNEWGAKVRKVMNQIGPSL